MGRAHRTRGAVAASSRQGATADRLRLLALPLSAVALALAFAAPAHAEGCQPWICRPSTAGVATVAGAVEKSKEVAGGFVTAQAGFAYRAVQFNREPNGDYGEERLGPLRTVKLTASAFFKLSLPACSPADRIFGCVGGEYEGYPTYSGRECGKKFYFYMTVGEVNELPPTLLECTPKPDPKPQQKQRKRAKRHR